MKFKIILQLNYLSYCCPGIWPDLAIYCAQAGAGAEAGSGTEAGTGVPESEG